MTVREKKAIEIYTRTNKIHTSLPSDEARRLVLQFPGCKDILEAMQWQAELCTNEFTKFHTERYPHTVQSTHDENRILNAGTEEV